MTFLAFFEPCAGTQQDNFFLNLKHLQKKNARGRSTPSLFFSGLASCRPQNHAHNLMGKKKPRNGTTPEGIEPGKGSWCKKI
jgi:hypothetical protein